MKKSEHSRIFRLITEALGRTPLTRSALISDCLGRLGLTSTEMADKSAGSKQNLYRSSIGTVINELDGAGMIKQDRSGRYYLASDKPVAVRIERCEREIIRALTEGKMTKSELRDRINNVLGTQKTVSRRDDDLVSTYMGQILKRLIERGAVMISAEKYSLTPKASARADDLNALLALKSDFIARLHDRGGEFFENYFMTLLRKYLEKLGKTVTECYVTGGSADGGIDGVARTVDQLGFREVIMVQTKNRLELISETDVRGFYGAVCAKQGSRGIFVTSADFHPVAKEFLDSIDNCVGINGDKLFSMAVECSYGIKRATGGRLSVDERII